MPKIAQVRKLMFNDEEIGMGFNSSTGLAVGSALEGFTTRVNPDATGMRVTASISIITTHEDLQETLDMSFEAEGRYGVISAAAKAKFSEQTNYNSDSTFVVARVVAANPLKRGVDFRISERANSLLNAHNKDGFKTAYGDSFVRGLQTGGEFYAVIRITSLSQSKQSSLGATLQAEMNGLVSEGSFEASYASANAESSTSSEYTATMYQNSGSGPSITPTVKIEDVMERFKSFPTIAVADPAAYGIEVATYDTIPLEMDTPDEEDAFLFALSDARSKKLQYIQDRNDLEFALKSPAFFEELPARDTLLASISTYSKLIDAVSIHAIKLSRGELNPPKVFDSLQLSPPITAPETARLKRRSSEVGSASVPVFAGCTSWLECTGVAADHGVKIIESKSYDANIGFHVSRTDPPANVEIPVTKSITVYTVGSGHEYLEASQRQWAQQAILRGGGVHL